MNKNVAPQLVPLTDAQKQDLLARSKSAYELERQWQKNAQANNAESPLGISFSGGQSESVPCELTICFHLDKSGRTDFYSTAFCGGGSMQGYLWPDCSLKLDPTCVDSSCRSGCSITFYGQIYVPVPKNAQLGLIFYVSDTGVTMKLYFGNLLLGTFSADDNRKVFPSGDMGYAYFTVE